MRKVTLPAHVVDIELVEQLHAYAIGDETAKNSFAEKLGRRQTLRRIVAHPSVVPVERVLGPPEEVRDPSDIALGEREPQRREAMPEPRPEQVAERVDRHHTRKVHRHGWR